MNKDPKIINLAETNIFATEESPLIWLPIFFGAEASPSREDGYCAMVQLRRPGGAVPSRISRFSITSRLIGNTFLTKTH